jgi:hypothetical protein
MTSTCVQSHNLYSPPPARSNHPPRCSLPALLWALCAHLMRQLLGERPRQRPMMFFHCRFFIPEHILLLSSRCPVSPITNARSSKTNRLRASSLPSCSPSPRTGYSHDYFPSHCHPQEAFDLDSSHELPQLFQLLKV